MSKINAPQLGRRTLLRGTGGAMALPLLEAMLPKSTAAGGENIASALPKRIGLFYFGTGMNMRQLEPKDEGRDYTLSPTLKVLAEHKGDFTFISGTYLEHGGGHQGDYTFSTGVKAKDGSSINNSVSMDQIAAEQLGRATRFPSLQLCVQRGTGFGGNLRTLSWNRDGVPLASENDPHVLFNRLFQVDGPEETELRKKGFRQRRSILDLVMEDAKRMERTVGKRDRVKLDEYFSSVREVEKQLERDIDWNVKPKPEVDTRGMSDFSESFTVNMPAGQFVYEKYARMMYDLIALAYETDSSRVISYVVRQESSGGTFPEFGVSKGFHELTHHGNDPKNLAELAKVDRIYLSHWDYFIRRLKSFEQPDGSSLLDHTLLGFSSGMGIGHSKDRLPTCLFGGKAAGVAHQGHLRLPEKTPLSRVWHTMLDRAGVDPGEPFQDSSGVIEQLIKVG
ncbi:hypothetical protein Enr13x_06720 [Stieleria neptunia]|uniref:DUF1552 domain-containing protein n=1 Tax=Stieleria neptunia TaxID=2527979 RepID=A0A518HJ10_9BACT|nr:DUF1552 domain-containing protein [Stieleria neptunia]QDV40836.1 hypothetical protein Enr13x_06720 [Stieleria neptunia]